MNQNTLEQMIRLRHPNAVWFAKIYGEPSTVLLLDSVADATEEAMEARSELRDARYAMREARSETLKAVRAIDSALEEIREAAADLK